MSGGVITVYHLYKVDEILRDTFRRYIEKAEVYYRTQIAYGFSMAKCTEAPYDQHYDENNFYNKKGYKEVRKISAGRKIITKIV